MKRFVMYAAGIIALLAGAIVEGRGAERGAAGQKHLDVKDLSPVTPAVAAKHAPLASEVPSKRSLPSEYRR